MRNLTLTGTPGDPSLTVLGALRRWVGELRQNRLLIHSLFWRLYLHRFEGSAAGWLWVVIMPCVPLAVYSTLQTMGLFSASLLNSGQDLPRAVYSGWGILFFLSFAEGLRLAAGTLVHHRREIIQTGIPKMVLLVVNTLHALGDTLLRAAALVLIILFFRVAPHPGIAWAPVLLLALTAFGFGLGCVLSLIAVYYRDLLNILSAALSYLFFASGVFIHIPDHDKQPAMDLLLKFLHWQPLYIIVDQSRELAFGWADRPWALACSILFCFAVVPIGLTLYYRGESLVNSHL